MTHDAEFYKEYDYYNMFRRKMGQDTRVEGEKVNSSRNKSIQYRVVM